MASSPSTEDMFGVKGLVAVVTGGATGIGFMIAKSLAANGAKKVYILGRRKNVLDKAAQEHPALAALECDVSSKASLQAAAGRIEREVGYINFLAANSGIYGPLNSWDPAATLEQNYDTLFAQTSMEDFTEALQVNVMGAVFTILAFLKLLDAGNKSAVERGTFGAPAYGASKAAAIHLTKQAGGHVPRAVRHSGQCNRPRVWVHIPTLCSLKAAMANAGADFPSEMASEFIAGRNPETEPASDDDFIPARKFSGYEEMAGTVVYMASRAGSFNNGMILLNDGGRTAVVPATY